jgi:toxin ParE1/3/4
MAFKVLVTELANEDLASGVRFIAKDNPSAAENFGLALVGKLKLLRDHPRFGRVLPERSDPDIREIIHAPYRIIYRVRESEQIIEVLRIWHGARGEPDLGR